MANPRAKITVTIDPDVLETIRAAVRSGQASSVSAFVEHAVRGQLAANAEVDALRADLDGLTGGLEE